MTIKETGNWLYMKFRDENQKALVIETLLDNNGYLLYPAESAASGEIPYFKF